MFERWDTSRVVMFAVGANINQLSEFIDVFGWRSVGLIDNTGVYSSWRVPQPEAPYPQDYIVDQDGVIRYWSDQYDAQEVINTIERLLATGVEETPVEPGQRQGLKLKVFPNPSGSQLRFRASGLGAGPGHIEVCDASGRVVDRLGIRGDSDIAWKPALPAGPYFFRLRGAAGETVTSTVRLR